MLGVTNLNELREKTTKEIFKVTKLFLEKVMSIKHALFLLPTLDKNVLNGTYYEIINEVKINDIPYMFLAAKNDIIVNSEIIEKGKF